MSKQPFLPLFFGDFLASTAEWTGEERSLYLTLLGHQWSLGSLPLEPEKVRRVVQWDRKLFAACWKTVGGKFTEKDGRLFNSRLEEHRDRSVEIANIRSEVGRRGGIASAEAKKQANGKQLLDQLPSNSCGFAQQEINHPSHPIPSEDTEGAPKPRRASRRCPKEFEPDLEFAVREVPDIDAEAEAAKFRDWEFAKPRSDWAACWRTWVRNARDRGSYAKAKRTAEGLVIQWQ
jgi:uncharacterized protein YdaU (DUF1376 family)